MRLGQADPFLGQPDAQLMLLGTFHFQDAGRDWYQPQRHFAIFSARRQGEVAAVVEQLTVFQPTKIAVERTPAQQEDLDAEYWAYGRGELTLAGHEIHQLAFRLAHRLGHDRVYGANAWDRHYTPHIDLDAYAHEHGQEPRLAQWSPRFRRLYEHGEVLAAGETLRETFLRINTEATVLQHHGHYLVDYFKLGDGDDYAGPDWSTGWYNRNLRIFANLQRLTTVPGERLLLLIGSGHLPILRHCGLASPEYALIEVSTYLG